MLNIAKGGFMNTFLNQFNDTAIVLISLSVILLAGFMLTRVTKIAKLPYVTGYIIAGVLIGPHVLNILPRNIIENMNFISDIALAFIAFGVGRFFKKDVFRETGRGVVVITLFESLLAGGLITFSMAYLFKLSWKFSLLLGAIATATAPASTMVTIRQYDAKGNFVNILLQVVALDDAICLVTFSIVTAFISTTNSSVSTHEIILPIIYNIGALLLGYLSGAVLSHLMTPKRSEDNRLILTISFLLGIAGLCAAINISPLLSCMLFGTTYINLTKDEDLFDQVEKFTPPILSMFFVVSGMSFDITTFNTLGLLGVAYFFIRIIGKYTGAYLGCYLTKTSRARESILDWL